MPGAMCAFVHCHNCFSNSPGKGFFRLPAILKRQGKQDEEISSARRAAWLAVLNRKDLLDGSKKLEYVNVCEDHFQGKKPSYFRDVSNIDWKPSVNLGGDSEKEARKAAAGKARQERRAARRKIVSQVGKTAKNSQPRVNSSIVAPVNSTAHELPVICDNVRVPTPLPEVIMEEIFIPVESFAQTEPVEFATVKSVKEVSCQTDLCGEDLDKLNCEIFQLKENESELHLSMAKLSLKCVKTSELNEETLRNDDNLVRFYTGLINFHILISLYNFVEKGVSHDAARNAISKFSEFLIVMMKLRLNVPFKDLAYRFNISEPTVSRIFSKWINGMYEKCKKLIVWPSRDVLYNSMPNSFRKAFGNRVTAIIDCFEIFTVQPSSLKARSETWSHYKNHNTVKYLISIAPHGFVNFISEGFCGRASDKQITEDSNYWRYLIPGDLVLADRGFRIAELLMPINAHVLTPAFTKKLEQLPYTDCTETRELANVRIHVERIIGLLRNKYPILAGILPIEFISTKPGELEPLIDKIVVICCALINICPPIVKE